jgi:hypothetical protein
VELVLTALPSRKNMLPPEAGATAWMRPLVVAVAFVSAVQFVWVRSEICWRPRLGMAADRERRRALVERSGLNEKHPIRQRRTEDGLEHGLANPWR